MSFIGWLTVIGTLLLVMALSSAFLQRLPVSTSAVYLAMGIAFGPLGFDLVRFDPASSAAWFERLTEIAVIVSLFVGGLRLRLPLRDPAWRAAFILAGPVMVLTIAGVALVAHFLLGMPAPLALLVGAVLAPTDPVLASAIAVNDAKDRDRMRYGLSGEAGLNDGMAFPFVVLALLWVEHGEVGSWIGEWVVERILWAVPAGLLLGFFLGRGLGRFSIFLRSRHRDTSAPSDFLALALIALSYVGAETIGAWGFLAVFAAGVGLRGAEIHVVARRPHPEHRRRVEHAEGETPPHPPAEEMVASRVEPEELAEPAVAAGVMVGEVMSFGDTLERLLEVLLVVMVGVALAEEWSLRAVPLALLLLFVIRPLATLVCLHFSPTTRLQRRLMGWFGLRGIGSLYYLSYALTHAPSEGIEAAVPITMTVIAISVVLHGISGQPVLDRYERSLE
jgi:NhaP-type Na+/H+ or K+/H+ antiporter